MNYLKTIKTISTLLNVETDLQKMLQLVLKSLLNETRFSSGWIFKVDRTGQHKLVAAVGLPPALEKSNCAPLREGGCWCKRDFLHKRLQGAVNMIECQRLERAEERNWGDTAGITHHATIPIYAGEEALGILNIADPQKDYYSTEELQLLELVALQIGTAIKRIELVDHEKERSLLYHKLGLFLQELHSDSEDRLEPLEDVINKHFSLAITSISTKNVNASAVAGETTISLLTDQVLTPLEVEISKHISEHIALSVERKRIAKAVKVISQLSERQRLSRELHDSVNQLLFSVNMTINGLTLRTTDLETKQHLNQASSALKAALNELRLIIHGLRGEELDLGLSSAVEQYSSLIGVKTNIEIESLNLELKQEELVYRIIQEALNNCKKHSGTSSASVQIREHQSNIVLNISDDGVGFLPDEKTHSFGLTSILKRVQELNAQVHLDTSPGKGTRWTIQIPNLWSE